MSDYNGAGGNPSGALPKATTKWDHNHIGLSMKENYGRGPTKGNLDQEGRETGEGKSVTKDKFKRAPSTAKGK